MVPEKQEGNPDVEAIVKYHCRELPRAGEPMHLDPRDQKGSN